jgi:ubiquitin carboxyl-terminal hydrolase 34
VPLRSSLRYRDHARCYFKEHNKEIKCKSGESRTIAFKLLLTLSRNSKSNLDTLVSRNLLHLSHKIPVLTKWNHVPAQDMRSPNGYVGIRNLGCICYMNAMLQQFYMTPTFRYGILMADDRKEP